MPAPAKAPPMTLADLDEQQLHEVMDAAEGHLRFGRTLLWTYRKIHTACNTTRVYDDVCLQAEATQLLLGKGHGTLDMYEEADCRCHPCRAANKRAHNR